jgi:polyisoprenoid-binding protein YceI
MERLTKYILLTLIVGVLQIQVGYAQQQLFTIKNSAEVKVSGTSTIHDWDMVTEGPLQGQASINLLSGKLEGIQSLTIKVPVKSLKSGKSSMDKNAYEALKAEQFQSVDFQLISLDEIQSNYLMATGKLSIAGVSQTVKMKVNYQVNGNSVLFSGILPITFTQFKLSPPTAVFNTIKTGNDLQISYKAIYEQKN